MFFYTVYTPTYHKPKVRGKAEKYWLCNKKNTVYTPIFKKFFPREFMYTHFNGLERPHPSVYQRFGLFATSHKLQYFAHL